LNIVVYVYRSVFAVKWTFYLPRYRLCCFVLGCAHNWVSKHLQFVG